VRCRLRLWMGKSDPQVHAASIERTTLQGFLAWDESTYADYAAPGLCYLAAENLKPTDMVRVARLSIRRVLAPRQSAQMKLATFSTAGCACLHDRSCLAGKARVCFIRGCAPLAARDAGPAPCTLQSAVTWHRTLPCRSA
jgi:hypothetical protein